MTPEAGLQRQEHKPACGLALGYAPMGAAWRQCAPEAELHLAEMTEANSVRNHPHIGV